MKTFLTLTLATLVAGASAFATSGTSSFPLPAAQKGRLNRQTLQGVALGTELFDKKVQVLKAQYSFAVLGGASTSTTNTLKLKDVDGKDAILPTNAVIRQVLIDVITAPVASTQTSGAPNHFNGNFNAPIFALGINNSADLKAAGSASTAYTAGLIAGTPVGTASTAVKVTGNSVVTLTLTGGSVTAGKFNAFIEYYLSD